MLGVHPLMGHNGGPSLNVADVFSTDLYTGNGGSQTITNGLNLAGEGGLVWCKGRSASQSHSLFDTIRGPGLAITTNITSEQYSLNGVQSFNNDGFALGSGFQINSAGSTYAAWSFRRAPKFFDAVPYIGNGAENRSIPHSLGITPGLIIVKRTDAAADWLVQARANVSSNYYLKLNQSGSSGSIWNGEILGLGSSSVFQVSVGGTTDTNVSGASYIAYLFAHDAASDGMVQCGSFATNDDGNWNVLLGWPPQYLLLKAVPLIEDWRIIDAARGMAVGSASPYLRANSSFGEGVASLGCEPTPEGFVARSFAANTTYIYMAIRAEGV